MKSPYEIVVMGEASRKFSASMWENLVEQASHFPPVGSSTGYDMRLELETHLLDGECAYMHEYHGDNPNASHPTKGWKFREFLPPAYRTAKSVVCNCIENGVKMHDAAGNVLGKSACEKAYKASRVDNPCVEVDDLYLQASKLIGEVSKIAKDLGRDDTRCLAMQFERTVGRSDDD